MNWLDREAMPPLPFHCLCTSERQYKQALRQIGANRSAPWLGSAPGATHTFENDGSIVCIVCISDFREQRLCEIYGLLIHEAVHVWQAYRDEVLNEPKPSIELEAYVIQRISQNLIAQFDKRTHRRTK